jgi:very-short-patch-repair endonuclease
MLDAQLNDHQQRRDQGIPCLSVVAGQVPAASQGLKKWLKSNSRDAVWVDGCGIDAAIGAWLRQVLVSDEMHSALAAHVGERANRTAKDVLSLARDGAEADIRALLDQTFPGNGGTGRRAVAEAVLCRGTALEELVESAQVERAAAIAYITACAHWCKSVVLPVLVTLAADNDAVEIAVRHLGAMVRAVPQFAVVLIAARDPVEHFLDLILATREQDLCRDGLVVLDEAGTVAEPIEALPEELRVLRETAVERINAAHTDPAEDDNARSAAERFLFAMLEATPETKGRFQLNARYPIPFSRSQSMEIDLSAPEPQIALEIDGYWHFQDPQRYRIDRAKDLALQRHGWIVMRTLADDVVMEFERIRATVIELLRARSRGTTNTNPKGV